MALRTIPGALEHARTIEKIAPGAWTISFTNPAGLITQALTTHSNLRVIGICDTPSEMFHRVAQALHEPLADVNCEYFGLNHLGWIYFSITHNSARSQISAPQAPAAVRR